MLENRTCASCSELSSSSGSWLMGKSHQLWPHSPINDSADVHLQIAEVSERHLLHLDQVHLLVASVNESHAALENTVWVSASMIAGFPFFRATCFTKKQYPKYLQYPKTSTIINNIYSIFTNACSVYIAYICKKC